MTCLGEPLAGAEVFLLRWEPREIDPDRPWAVKGARCPHGYRRCCRTCDEAFVEHGAEQQRALRLEMSGDAEQARVVERHADRRLDRHIEVAIRQYKDAVMRANTLRRIAARLRASRRREPRAAAKKSTGDPDDEPDGDRHGGAP